ncbi:MAG TPA: M12 family metallopeptidase [Chitinophagaceae bacterium]|nr:M12 family metallopeptidase [Chitinophagaceae bacterium]
MLLACMMLVTLGSAAQEQFTHIVTKANKSGNNDGTWLDIPQLNGNAAAIIMATPIVGEDLNLSSHPVGLFYFMGKWNIFNLDQKAMPEGTQFKVEWFINPGTTHFKYTINKGNLQRDGTALIDHQALNNKPGVQFRFIPSWIPELKEYANRQQINIVYDDDTHKWIVSNLDKKPIYPNVAYNIIVFGEENPLPGEGKEDPIVSKLDPKTYKPKDTTPVISKISTKTIKNVPVDPVPVITGNIDNNGFVTKKPIPKSYDFSKVKICVDQVFNKNLPPRTTQAAIPKVNSDGILQPVTSVTQGLSGLTEYMWSAGEKITVASNPGSPAAFIAKVKKYVKEWETYANITFEFITSVSSANIKIDFKQDNSSWSWIGRDVLDNPNNYVTMNFGWFTAETPETEFSRTIIHEFGHALGFIHEHQAAGAGIAWDKDKVYSYFGGPPNNWDTAKIDANVFATYSKTSTNSSAYDRLSIMHYFFSSDLTTDGSSFTENTNLSTIDKSFAKQVYPFPPTATGILRTGDDCDEIEFSIEYGAVAKDQIEFVLLPGLDHNKNMVNWWKMIGIPVKDLPAISGLFLYTTKKLPVTWIDRTKPITFGKAKILGVHTGLPFTWNVWPAIIGGCRVKFIWRRDSCN